MYGDLILLPVEVHDFLALVCLILILPLLLPLLRLITQKDDATLKTVKEIIGFAAVFGGIFWYTTDPMLKKAIKLAASSADVKVTEKGLEYKPFSYFPLIFVISSRDGRPAIGFGFRGGG